MTSRLTRRRFLGQAAALSLVGAAAPLAFDLATFGAAAAGTGYRALVCVFLLGGNDHANLLVPSDPAGYAEYAAARTTAALPLGSLAGTDLGPVASQGGRSFALHPSLVNVRRLYGEGRAAVVANVGPLVAPTSLAQYRAGSVPLPPKLQSHNDQQAAWQAHRAGGEGTRLGWGGTLADRLGGGTNSAFTAISVNGNALWPAGRTVTQYQIAPEGGLTLNATARPLFGSVVTGDAYQAFLTAGRAHLLENSLAATNRRSLDTNAQLRAALPPAGSLVPAVSATNPLAGQLSAVARMIAARATLGLDRQIFFVGLGGFDTHDGLQARQAALLAQFDAAVDAFWSWLGALGAQSDVVLFTASDFGRALASNGDGSDHGWGGHHLVIGGAVAGGTIHGRVPPSTFGTANDIGNGVLLPDVSVDQYAATFGRWLGVPADGLRLALPNLANFDPTPLPFLP